MHLLTDVLEMADPQSMQCLIPLFSFWACWDNNFANSQSPAL